MRRYVSFISLIFIASCGIQNSPEQRQHGDAPRGTHAGDPHDAKTSDKRARVVYGNLSLADHDLGHIAAFVNGVETFPGVPYGRTVQTDEGLIEFERFGRNIPVIKLKDAPGYVLKCEENEFDARQRVDGALCAAKVCADRGLDRLFVPGAALIEIGVEGAPNKYVAVEAFLDFEAGHEAQRLAFENVDAELEEIVEQLTILVCHTDFRDVRWDNIPLFEHDGRTRVALIDTEPTTGRGLIDAFVDWGSNGYFMRTPALIGTFPAYAERIARVAERELSSATFAALEPSLRPALAKAKRIQERDMSVAAYHRLRGIEPGSPALDIGQVEALVTPEQRDQQAGLRAALADINAVIARQQESMQKLPRAREWRLTMDIYTVDSNFKKNVYGQYGRLLELLPRMAEAGLIHSYLTHEEAIAVGVDIRRHHLNTCDYVVQF